jgi:hypothetical protein
MTPLNEEFLLEANIAIPKCVPGLYPTISKPEDKMSI